MLHSICSGFEHKNIVRLLGVCLEKEPHWLILELMEGGDLLSYIRSCRPSDVSEGRVTTRATVHDFNYLYTNRHETLNNLINP
jgi:serine/threonine protein kinase